jgi:hypothetical protein
MSRWASPKFSAVPGVIERAATLSLLICDASAILLTRTPQVGVGTMIAHDPLHRSGRAELPHPAPTLGKRRPSAREDKVDTPEPAETIAQCSASCGATAGGYPGCDEAVPSATDNPRLGERRTVPGRSWAPRNSGSDPAGPSASTLPVPERACACVATVLLSKPAAWLATSGASSVAAP